MQSENLLRTECGGGYDSDDGTGGGLRGSGGHQYSAYHHQYNVQEFTVHRNLNILYYRDSTEFSPLNCLHPLEISSSPL